MTLIRPVNKGQGHLFWYQSISHIRTVNSNFCSRSRTHRLAIIHRGSVGSVALLVARRIDDRKVAGSRPTKVVFIIVLTGNRMGVNCPLWPVATPSEL